MLARLKGKTSILFKGISSGRPAWLPSSFLSYSRGDGELPSEGTAGLLVADRLLQRGADILGSDIVLFLMLQYIHGGV
jgi:hypothetical protein